MIIFDQTALEVLKAMGYTCVVVCTKELGSGENTTLDQLVLKPFLSDEEAESWMIRNPLPGSHMLPIDEDVEVLASGVPGVKAVLEII